MFLTLKKKMEALPLAPQEYLCYVVLTQAVSSYSLIPYCLNILLTVPLCNPIHN